MSLWQLFSNLRVSYRSAYDCEADDVSDCSILDLDPVDVPGCEWAELLRQAVHMPDCVRIVEKLLNGDPEALDLNIPAQPKIPWTADKWQKHINCLEEWKVVKNLGKGCISRWVSTYFGVAKASGTEARSVFSGRKISGFGRKSRPVNLLEIVDLLRGASCLPAGSLNFWSLDLRHWFHQIKIDTRLQRLFHIVIKDVTYAWLRLPMGWTWSPYICQLLSWLLVLHKENQNEEELFDTSALSSDQLPSFISIKGAGGFVSILYDNFGVFCDNADKLDLIKNRIHRNFEIFGVKVKDGSETLHTSKQMRVEEYSEEFDPERKRPLPQFLGLEFGRIHFGRLHFSWRAAPSKIKKWRLLKVPTSGDIARKFASVVGKIVWFSHIHLEPLHTIKDVLEVAKNLGQFVGTTYKKWDMAFTCDSVAEELLLKQWERVLKNAWQEKPRASKQTYYLFTDASEKGWGFVACTMDGVILDSGAFQWSDARKPWHIFIKETAAAVWSLKRCVRFGDAILFVDNTATQHAVRRGYSSNSIACALIASLGQVVCQVRRIHTLLNPSDEPSRGKDVDPQKVLIAIADWAKRKISEEKNCPSKNEFGLRHVEPDNEEEYDEDELADFIHDSVSDPSLIDENAYRPRPTNTVVYGEGFSIADPSCDY